MNPESGIRNPEPGTRSPSYYPRKGSRLGLQEPEGQGDLSSVYTNVGNWDYKQENMTALRDSVVALVARRGYERRAEPFELSAGQRSFDYIDGKRALASGPDMVQVAQAILELTESRGVEFEAAGGLTMGADPLAHAIAIVGGKSWFSVLKEQKQHGKRQLVAGIDLRQGMPVLLLDDVTTTGRSIMQAYEALQDYGVEVVMAITLVDRGDTTNKRFSELGVLYEPLLTYDNLGIVPLADVSVNA